jgi:predicted permease
MSVFADARLALRSWARSPTFTLVAVASIGLGIGSNTAIFTLMDEVLLRLLPVRNPRELVQVSSAGERYGSNWGDGTELSYPTFRDLRDRNRAFSGMFCRFGCPLHLAFGDRTVRAVGELVSGGYFPVLGVGAVLGRTLGPEDDVSPAGHPVAVLSHAFWTSQFGADPGVVGRALVVNGRSYTVVGVAQEGFEGIDLGRPTQVFVPMMMKAQLTGWDGLEERLFRWTRVFARLRPGVTAETARAALEPLLRTSLEADLADPEFAKASPGLRRRYLETSVVVEPGAQGRSAFRRGLTQPLLVLMGAALGVLLIACANVANLLLARGTARRREMAVRLSLGATRGRLVSQLLVESVLLALAGGLAGLGLAAFGAPLVLGLFASPDVPHPVSASPDPRILAFNFALSALTGILFGLAPALQATRPDVAPTLKDQAGSVVGGGPARFRKALVASQVAVSLLLVIGAGLFLRTLHNLMAVPTGFDTARLLSFELDPSLGGYTPRRTKDLSRTLLARLRTLPGVTGASLASVRLLQGNQWTSDFTVEGYGHGAEEDMDQNCNAVAPGFFQAMGVPLLAGREFDERDAILEEPPSEKEAPFRVAIVNQRFARRYFGDRDPVGHRIGFGTNPGRPTPIEIVGLVADTRYTSVRDDPQRQVFFPFLEDARPQGFTVYVRTSQPAETVFAAVRRVVHELDSSLPVSFPRTLEEEVASSVSRERMVADLSGVFAALATLLAVVGLYGVMAYTVERRTREIGIRMALGANRRQVEWMVVREAAAITLAGMVAALAAAWGLGRLVASQLYGVAAFDPPTLLAAVGLLLVVSLAAGFVPSRRASRIEPTAALRYE